MANTQTVTERSQERISLAPPQERLTKLSFGFTDSDMEAIAAIQAHLEPSIGRVSIVSAVRYALRQAAGQAGIHSSAKTIPLQLDGTGRLP